jgi:predicted MFS family arabinose efflux permease
MFTLASFFIRWLAITTLVFGTYNPSGYSYLHWLADWQQEELALKVAVGLVIFGLFWLTLVAAWLVLRLVGVLLLTGIVLSLMITGWQLGLVPPTSASVQYLLLGMLATALTFGVSYGHIRYRLTGQVQSRILQQLNG